MLSLRFVKPVLLLGVFTVATWDVLAGPQSCEKRVNNTNKKLLECVTLQGVREHQAAFQSIADANGGVRASGTPGYDASVAYVAQRMEAAGYDVTIQEFPFYSGFTSNVLAESPDGDPNNVVMVGAHLDSVPNGPGIQDNGSGSSAILEVAEQMAKVKPRNKLRFAWWGAEESGLLGSSYYVNTLTPDEQNQIRLYLNFDMIGSPNFVRFVYDGDGSSFGVCGPSGSDAIEAFFGGFYAGRGLAFEPIPFDGTSAYQAFLDAGIPAGGLFTGSDGIKTPEQAAIYGGTAGDQYDPCYHLACDTFDNISLEVLAENASAVAAATLHYAMMKTEY
jgi:aminopeptidase S